MLLNLALSLSNVVATIQSSQSFVKPSQQFSAYIDEEMCGDHIIEIFPQQKRVAAHLSLTKADLEGIKNGAWPCDELIELYIFRNWKKKYCLGRGATYQMLLEAIRYSGPEYSIQANGEWNVIS